MSGTADLTDDLKADVAAKIRNFPDFPTTGILFRDMMPLMADSTLLSRLCAAIATHCTSLATPVDAVAALEARGYLFGPQVAMHLNVPFVPIRKRGKLPGEVHQASYQKEYGPDFIEIQKDAVKAGWKVFLMDDLIATGGSMCAAVEVIEKAEATVVEAFCLMELDELQGRLKLTNIPLLTLIHF